MSLSFVELIKRLFRKAAKSAPRTHNPNRFRPMLEACEDRTTPTPVVSVTSLGDVTEGAGFNTAYAQLSRTETSGTLIVNYTTSGTATGGGTDYYSMGTITFMDGQATATAMFMLNNDSTSEPTETLIVTLTSDPAYTIDSPASATINILDNDAQYVYVGVEDAGEDGDTGMIGFYRTGDLSASLTANFTVGGTATSGTDYTSIGTTVTFSAGSHYAGKVITALADNLVEGTETVSATVTTGTGYSVGSPSSGTLSLIDDPATISVEATDTFEGAATGRFSFTRTGGNIGAALTVSYSITGTATSGTDYTALTGSVTFAEDDDEVDVTVYLLGDSTGEHTETVTLTLEEAEGLLFGNDSDTVFVRDNDTRQLVWTGLGSDGDWTNSDNWYIVGTTTTATPTQYDDVFFNASGTGNVTNVGSGLSTLYGLHITGTYNGTLTLANGLSVGTFEQTIGTLQMLDAADDLLVTHALLWCGGTLGATDDGADVVVDGASARIDPPDTGSMSTSSTLRFIGTTLATFLSGTLNFAAGNGLFVNAEVNVLTPKAVKVEFEATTISTAKIEIAANGEFAVKRKNLSEIGILISQVPLLNSGGHFLLGHSIHVKVSGNLGGGNGPSFSQTSGSTTFWTGSIEATSGVSITGGTFNVVVVNGASTATVIGNMTFAPGAMGSLNFQGHEFGTLHVVGEVTWSSGKYRPRINGAMGSSGDVWEVTRAVAVGNTASVDPVIGNEANAGNTDAWMVLDGRKGITTTAPNQMDPPSVTGVFSEHWYLLPDTTAPRRVWSLRKN